MTSPRRFKSKSNLNENSTAFKKQLIIDALNLLPLYVAGDKNSMRAKITTLQKMRKEWKGEKHEKPKN